MAIKVLFILLSLLVLSSTQACLALSPNCWNCSYIYEPQLNYYSCSRCATGYYSIAMSTNVHNTYYVGIKLSRYANRVAIGIYYAQHVSLTSP